MSEWLSEQWSSLSSNPTWVVMVPLVLGLGGVGLGWVVERIAMARLRTSCW